MAKLGRYSSGLDGREPKMSAYGGVGNGGYDKKVNMMGDNGMTKHESMSLTDGVTAQGSQKALQIDKRIKRKM